MQRFILSAEGQPFLVWEGPNTLILRETDVSLPQAQGSMIVY